MTFFTSASERMRITTAGVVELTSGQLKFPATQNASADANTLDDYEEGTFTPTYEGTTTAGTTTYTIQNGYYTKIGNIVTVIINLGWSGATGTGVSQVGGLPFQTTTESNNYCAISIRNDGFAQNSGQLQGYVNINTTHIRLGYANLTNGTDIDSPIDTSVGRLMIQATYRTST
jgi:hypothetical protein